MLYITIVISQCLTPKDTEKASAKPLSHEVSCSVRCCHLLTLALFYSPKHSVYQCAWCSWSLARFSPKYTQEPSLGSTFCEMRWKRKNINQLHPNNYRISIEMWGEHCAIEKSILVCLRHSRGLCIQFAVKVHRLWVRALGAYVVVSSEVSGNGIYPVYIKRTFSYFAVHAVPKCDWHVARKCKITNRFSRCYLNGYPVSFSYEVICVLKFQIQKRWHRVWFIRTPFPTKRCRRPTKIIWSYTTHSFDYFQRS